jgi:hypothetical protein
MKQRLQNLRLLITLNIKNIDETHSNQPKIQRKIHTSLWIFKNSRKTLGEPKISLLLSNVCNTQNEKPYHRVGI